MSVTRTTLDHSTSPEISEICVVWAKQHAAALKNLDNPLDPGQRAVVGKALNGLHADLGKTEAYRQALVAASQAMPSASKKMPGLSWFPLFNALQIKLGLLTIDPSRPIPLHDHPGSTVALQILSGRLQTTQYDSLAGNDGFDPNFVLLRRRCEYTLARGDIAICLPRWGNIHQLAALGGTVVILDILINPYPSAARSWFVPVLDAPCRRTLDTHKLLVRRLPNNRAAIPNNEAQAK